MVFLVVVGYVNAQVLAVVIQTMEASLRVMSSMFSHLPLWRGDHCYIAAQADFLHHHIDPAHLNVGTTCLMTCSMSRRRAITIRSVEALHSPTPETLSRASWYSHRESMLDLPTARLSVPGFLGVRLPRDAPWSRWAGASLAFVC